VHGSLLPKFRGAAPIQWSILEMERETGVTLMQMDEGMDTGPMLSTRVLSIGDDENAEQLAMRLAMLGATIVREDLGKFLRGELVAIAQDDARATTAPMLTKEMSNLDFRASAKKLHARVRGLKPWPGTATMLGARRLIVHESTLQNAPTLYAGAPGEIVRVERDVLWVATGDGALGLTELQLEGKKRLRTREFLVGHPVRVGTMLGVEPPTAAIATDSEEPMNSRSIDGDRS
jgi:methionyl-tRNA formyltransferase